MRSRNPDLLIVDAARQAIHSLPPTQCPRSDIHCRCSRPRFHIFALPMQNLRFSVFVRRFTEFNSVRLKPFGVVGRK